MHQPLLNLPLPCNEAASLVSGALRRAGFQVERSFDLQSARSALRAPQDCPCPHHGTAECSCQFVVLLVSRDGGAPLSLVAHSQEHHTMFTLERSKGSEAMAVRLRELVESLTPDR